MTLEETLSGVKIPTQAQKKEAVSQLEPAMTSLEPEVIPSPRNADRPSFLRRII
jgi:hypothetical protein